jgi:broad specificity phosphatase PhoE
MPLIYLVRHGQAAAGYSEDPDPGLDDLGRAQAEAASETLLTARPKRILSSPLKRAQETAHPYAQAIGESVTLEPRVSEIPSPNLSVSERGAWLQGIMQGQWSNQSEALQAWQAWEDTVIFSHFVAINALVSAVTKDDQVLVFRPDNASITTFRQTNGELTLVAQGESRLTVVN